MSKKIVNPYNKNHHGDNNNAAAKQDSTTTHHVPMQEQEGYHYPPYSPGSLSLSTKNRMESKGASSTNIISTSIDNHTMLVPSIPLGLTGVICQSKQLPISGRGGQHDGNGGTTTISSSFLHYTIYRPRNLYQFNIPPLICVAGGPLLPCQYLYPMIHLISDRSIVLYDQVGCGQSSSISSSSTLRSSSADVVMTPPPTTESRESYSQKMVRQMVNDLSQLIDDIPGESFHLFGHSFGGILVYEYLLQQQRNNNHNRNNEQPLLNVGQPEHDKVSVEENKQSSVDQSRESKTTTFTKKKCLSAILASTPVSVADVEKTCQELINNIISHSSTSNKVTPDVVSNSSISTTTNNNNNDMTSMDHEEEDMVKAMCTFSLQHECRVSPTPLGLQQAYMSAGFQSTSTGFKLIRDYVAPQFKQDLPNSTTTTASVTTVREEEEEEDHDHQQKEHDVKVLQAKQDHQTCTLSFPPVLVLRGEHDFVTEECCIGWTNHRIPSNQYQFMTLAGCAHYGMLENETLYGNVISSFLRDHEPPLKPLVFPPSPPPRIKKKIVDYKI